MTDEQLAAAVRGILQLVGYVHTNGEWWGHDTATGKDAEVVAEGVQILRDLMPPPVCPWSAPIDTTVCPVHGGTMAECPLPDGSPFRPDSPGKGV